MDGVNTMNWLGQWLKEITMIMLLVTFIDLLLPNRSMQRYVKLMLSLIILLTLLSPVLKLYDIKIAKQLASKWEDPLSLLKIVENRGASVAHIKRQGELLAKEHKTSALQLAEGEIGRQMKERLIMVLHHENQVIQRLSKQPNQVQVERLKVKLACNAKGEPIIERIELGLSSKVTVTPTGSIDNIPTANARDSERISGIKPIKPVQIGANTLAQRQFQRIYIKHNDPVTALREVKTILEEVRDFRKKISALAIQSLMSAWMVGKNMISIYWINDEQ